MRVKFCVEINYKCTYKLCMNVIYMLITATVASVRDFVVMSGNILCIFNSGNYTQRFTIELIHSCF